MYSGHVNTNIVTNIGDMLLLADCILSSRKFSGEVIFFQVRLCSLVAMKEHLRFQDGNLMLPNLPEQFDDDPFWSNMTVHQCTK